MLHKEAVCGKKVDLAKCDEADTLKRVHNGCMAVCIYHVAQGSCLRQKGGPGDMC